MQGKKSPDTVETDTAGTHGHTPADIVWRLRSYTVDSLVSRDAHEAADEIERLRAEVVELEYTIVEAPEGAMSDPDDKMAYLAARGVVHSDVPAEEVIRRLRDADADPHAGMSWNTNPCNHEWPCAQSSMPHICAFGRNHLSAHHCQCGVEVPR